MSINQLYELSRRSFLALNAGMNVAGQNVANAETEGYTRKRVSFAADSPALGGLQNGNMRFATPGTGVSVATFERVRDGMLGAAALDGRSALGQAEEEHRVLSALEGIFPADGAGSLGDVLDGFWKAWSDLADHPTDSGVRNAVRGQAETLTSSLNSFSSRVDGLQAETFTALRQGVSEANGLLKGIAELNERISRPMADGAKDLEAADQRDRLVKQLASFAPLKVQEDATGAYNISIQGVTAVQRDQAFGMKATLGTDGQAGVQFVDSGAAFRPSSSSGGRIGAFLQTHNTDIPAARADLDRIAETLVNEINAAHIARYDPATDTTTSDGPPFFQWNALDTTDKDGRTAATIRLSADVLADAGKVGAPGNLSADKTEIAVSIAALRGKSHAGTGGDTIENFAVAGQSRLGARVAGAVSRADGHSATLAHIEGLEQAVSGVSVEDEMTSLIKFQQSYAATARVLRTAEEMMSTLLAI